MSTSSPLSSSFCKITSGEVQTLQENDEGVEEFLPFLLSFVTDDEGDDGNFVREHVFQLLSSFPQVWFNFQF